VAVWAYYPLIRGTAMAFMDYQLMGERSWIGLDNFINVVLDEQFHQSVIATLKYAVIALSLTFLAPIILAIMLHEIPWGKEPFRVVFFLPQVCSGVVIMLLWKQIFESSAQGLLNQMVMGIAGLLGREITPVDWLGSTLWAPICVVLPMLWANAGVGSLIYLAALKMVPDELYEAADLDGAGLWAKTRHVTLPMLYALIVINFVGAFIGTFHQMQNIFVMTGGNAGTRVLSLHIWLTAYADLKFGPATATAWILGSMLIGFTVWQLRILKRVEFRRAAEN
jgi:ABC-type sugar transport system permease subunit